MTTQHTEIFLVRHGQTDANTAQLFDGFTDKPLNQLGMRQAQLVAERVGGLADLRSLYSSPLQRALLTARAISRRTGLEPVTNAGLREMNFGLAEGHSMAEIVELWPDLAAEMQDGNWTNVQFPSGESSQEFHDRVRQTLDLIATAHRGERIVVVAHGGIIRSTVAQVLGYDFRDWRKITVENCSITHIELASTGSRTRVVNDVVHLESLTIDELPEAADR